MKIKPRNGPFTARMSFDPDSPDVGVQIVDFPDVIRERVAATQIAPGIYEADLIAPAESGEYAILWDSDGDGWRWEDLKVTGSLYTPGGGGGEEDPEPETPDEITLIRLEIGDENAEHFTDSQLTTLLEQDLTVLAAAAHACDILATRYAGAADITVDGQTIKRSQLAAGFAKRAQALRDRADAEAGGNIVTSVSVSARL